MTHKELIALGADYSPEYDFNGETMPALYTLTLEHIEAVAAHKREACAKVCESLLHIGCFGETLKNGPITNANIEIRKCAAAIRARATTPKETA